MLKFQYQLLLELSKDDAIHVAENTLSSNCIQHETRGDIVESIWIPFPVLSFDSRAYSRRNWIGINPFIFTDRVKIFAQHLATDSNVTHLTVSFGIGRAVVIFISVMVVTLMVVLSLVRFDAVFLMILVLGIAIVTMAHIFFCLRYLTKSELMAAVKSFVEKVDNG